MSSYTRLTLAEREEISRHVAAGISLRAIARHLRRSPSTIARELRRSGKRRLHTNSGATNSGATILFALQQPIL